MASWYDYLALVITIALTCAVIWGSMMIYEALNNAKRSAKQRLKNKGVNVSKHGVSVKREIRLVDRETYMDATQRGFVKALSNAYYGPAPEDSMHDATPASSPRRRTVKDSDTESVHSDKRGKKKRE
ncbi:hypothetical protein K474DRAFT_1664743 [Panus rudis PR-1116 ss-1]|nr:hypothetical protein K474DRAFT_1664743 [Panus rudis PR-1116 ss-1]